MGPAYLEFDLGNYAVSEKYFNEAEGLLKKELGDQHPIYAQLLDHRARSVPGHGQLRRRRNRTTRPRWRCGRRSTARITRWLPPRCATTGAWCTPGIAQEGEKLLQEAADIYSKSSDHPAFEYASTLLALGEAQRKRNDLATARRTFEQALDVAAQGLGDEASGLRPRAERPRAGSASRARISRSRAAAEGGHRHRHRVAGRRASGPGQVHAGVGRALRRARQVSRGRAAVSLQFRNQRPRAERRSEHRIGEQQAFGGCEPGRSDSGADRVSAARRRSSSGSARAGIRSGGAPARAACSIRCAIGANGCGPVRTRR